MRKIAIALILATATQLSASTPEQSPLQIVPAVASTEGVGGSSWRSDLIVHNPSDRAVSLRLFFLPSGFEGVGSRPDMVELEPPLESNQTMVLTDVVGTHFPENETGALLVWALETGSSYLSPVPIAVSSRTWTSNAAGGSFGQGIPGIAWSQSGADLVKAQILPDIESSEDFRTNLGIVNPTGLFQESFSVEILDASGASVGTRYYRLGPGAHIQRNDILSEFGLDGGGYTAIVTMTRSEEVPEEKIPYPIEPPSHPHFVVYGSKVDNISNDPTFVEAQTQTTQSGLPKHRVIPAAARVNGEDGSSWTTDVTVHSAGEGGTTALVVELVPTGGEGLVGGGLPEKWVTVIRSGETKNLDDIIGTGFPDQEVAALVVQGLVGGGSLPDLRVTSRTWTPTGDGEGTMGQGIPGIPRQPVADPVVVPGLESSEFFRSNLGLVNPTFNIRERFEVEVFSDEGESEGVLTYTLEPWSHLQVNSILDELGLAGSGFTAVVTMAESENLMLRPSESWEPAFMAYGSRIDRLTNDPSYIEASRLVPPSPEGGGDWVDFDYDDPWFRCQDETITDEATVVRAFDQDLHWFGAENHRSVVREVDFPQSDPWGQSWNQVGLRFHLECPENGLCDHWDRTGSLQLVLNPNDPEEDWEYLEIMRHITPYRVGMCQYVDITPLAPLLVGRRTLVSWIDTWVGPGHPDGEGWRITWDFVFYPGQPRQADEVVNIWGRRSIEVGNLDPDRTVDAQIDPVEVAIPADASHVEARLITTGHSFGNALNCAEFCVMRQDLWIDGERRSVLPWRTDCEHNPINDQQGTWRYDRNGWCPGAITVGQTIDITDMVTPGEIAELDFDIRLGDGTEYENTNPGGGATPIEYVSLQLYIYRD